MNYKNISVKKPIYILVSFLSLALCLLYFGSSQKVSASHDTAKAECNIRVNKADCLKAIQDCGTNHTCATNASKNINISGRRIFRACQTTPDPQACDNAAKAKCIAPTYNTSAEVTACRQEVADKFKSGESSDPISFAPSGPDKLHQCGKDASGGQKIDPVKTRFDLGCKGESYPGGDLSPIVDMAYAFIRFLTVGVGLVLAMSMIYAGIMYSTSGGNSEQTQKAKDRILGAMVALLFYLLISALANYLIPGGLF